MQDITAKYPGECKRCGRPHVVGDKVVWSYKKKNKGVLCLDCHNYFVEHGKRYNYPGAKIQKIKDIQDGLWPPEGTPPRKPS